MEWITKQNILIVGLGLMGGSYAKGLKRIGYHLMAIDTNEESIKYALENEIIDEGSTTPEVDLISKADVVVFALYPHVFKEWIKNNQQYLKSGIYITDVTGAKSNIVYDIQNMLRKDVEYIPAHPMAGKEVSGVQNCDDRIFHNANYIVTPTNKNTPEAIQWCKDLGHLLGCRKISTLSPEEHDKMIGYVSQLTHCIAVSLMDCNDNPHIVDYTGDSFRDLTRIANINDKMWSELFLINKDALLEEMNAFIDELCEMREMIKSDDAAGLRAKMQLSTQRRKLFNK